MAKCGLCALAGVLMRSQFSLGWWLMLSPVGLGDCLFEEGDAMWCTVLVSSRQVTEHCKNCQRVAGVNVEAACFRHTVPSYM